DSGSCRDDVDAAAWSRKAHGITQEVDEHLADAVDVTEIHHVLSRLRETHGDLTRASLGRDERRRFAHHVPCGAVMTGDPEPAGVALSHVQKVIRHTEKMFTRALNAREIAPLLLSEGRRKLHLQELQVTADGVEWRSELVRGQRHEPLTHHDRSFRHELGGFGALASLTGNHVESLDFQLALRQFLKRIEKRLIL